MPNIGRFANLATSTLILKTVNANVFRVRNPAFGSINVKITLYDSHVLMDFDQMVANF